jgi:C-terminal processing protease CtpA/Prc
MSVTAVVPGSEAEQAGLQVGDTILELQGKPAGQESRQELSQLSAGTTLAVRVRSRRAGERELKWKIGSREEIQYQVSDLDPVTPAQRARRNLWLKGEAEAASTGAPAP